MHFHAAGKIVHSACVVDHCRKIDTALVSIAFIFLFVFFVLSHETLVHVLFSYQASERTEGFFFLFKDALVSVLISCHR